MVFFGALHNRITEWRNSAKTPLVLNGFTPGQWSFILDTFLNNQMLTAQENNQFLLVTSTNDEAEELYEQLRYTQSGYQALYFPGEDFSPYSAIMASETNLFKQFFTLDKLTQGGKLIVITSATALLKKLPPTEIIKENAFSIEIDDIIAPDELASKLFSLGYSASVTVEEPGTFSKRGEIFDIYPISHPPIRIHYFDELIEAIFAINLETNRTLKDQIINKLHIGPAPHILARQNFDIQLRANLSNFSGQFKEKYNKRKEIFQHLNEHEIFDGYPSYLPLFFEKTNSFLDYFDPKTSTVFFFNNFNAKQTLFEFIETLRSDFESKNDSLNSECILPEPSKLYFTDDTENIFSETKYIEINHTEISNNISTSTDSFNAPIEKSTIFLKRFINPTLPRHEFLKQTFLFFKNQFLKDGHLFFCYQSESSKNEFNRFLELFHFSIAEKKKITLTKFHINHGFYYESESLLVLSESDLFTSKRNKTKTQKNIKTLDYFAEQLGSLKVGDYVIHSTFGLGKYQGLEKLDVAGGQEDYLIISYSDQDKVYVPVYKLNLIQKHADSGLNISLDSLRTNKFAKIKGRAKIAAKKLAFDYLKLQAERETSKAYSFSPPDETFKEFELAFPFQETPDQLTAIDNVIEDMQKARPMDHLVCGDVGFGKTEVAMRAAFKATLDSKQVAILVPTTILALQHYHSFTQRFKNFPVTIEFLTRFKSAKESKEIMERIASGHVDIVIGTHKLLSQSIKYKDLGLVIVDEEQRFGVGHKEKLKLLKASVDFLTLTATPIPRTLQMSFLGLRDLSLIQTAPPRRQSIKSYIIKGEEETIKLAIEKELARGGQVFIVHNKVQDIEQYSNHIRELVPHAKIMFAHGQLPEKDLEKRMTAFYHGDYQVLVATTIIESGIDIPNANTMIVDRADTFGLSQLHQLRGRIGRSEKKAYAYFVIPKNRPITDIAQQRLKALYTYADMGSGFNIASCDLEIRGAGDLLGASQSGHIEAIGLELYMELLKEAIAELKGQKYIAKKDIEISTLFPSNIPETYISNSNERLKFYKKLSNCSEILEIETIMDDLNDVYGSIPESLINLCYIIKARIILQNTGIKSIKVGKRSFTLVFEKDHLEKDHQLRDSIVKAFLSDPKTYQFTPDYKAIYHSKTDLNSENLVLIAQDIEGKIVPKTATP